MKSKEPQRQCAGCRAVKNKKDLVRLTRTADGIRVDTQGRTQGRGLYCCRDMACFERLKKSHGLERGFGAAVAAEVYEALKEEIESGS